MLFSLLQKQRTKKEKIFQTLKIKKKFFLNIKISRIINVGKLMFSIVFYCFLLFSIVFYCFLLFSVFQKQQMESSRKQTQKLNRQLGMEKVDRESFDLTLDELTDLKTKAEEQEKTISALQQSCKVSFVSYYSHHQGVWRRWTESHLT